MDDVFWPGIGAMIAMYLSVFAVGLFAGGAEVERERGEPAPLSELLLAGRSLPLWVGLLTMTATWVGGGYINGTAEYTFSSGLAWGAQAGIGYAVSLILGGLFFARIMRRHGFSTLVDPLEDRYGAPIAALLMIPAVLAELFWSAAILVALGTTFGTIMGLGVHVSIVLSAAVAVLYTVFGGLRAVAYTDVVQLLLIVVGLGIAIPFAVSTAGGLDAVLAHAEIGTLLSDAREAASYGDWLVLLMLGGIPWNVYFQRVLSSRDADTAVRQSVVAGFLCAALAVPPLVLGLAGQAVDWAALGATPAGLSLGGPEIVTATLAETPASVLPYLLRLAVPTWIAVIGLGAISAAVMSSVDSSILSASSLIAWNGYARLVNRQATERQVVRLVRVLIVLLGAAATVIALEVASVSALWLLCGDVVYTVLFPQLALALYDPKANRVGALAGFVVSATLRIGGGDATLGIPAFLAYPDWGAVDFPFRTLAMLTGLVTAIAVARLTTRLDPPRALVPRIADGA